MPEPDVLVIGVTQSSVTVTSDSAVGPRLQLFLRSIMGARATGDGAWDLPIRDGSRREVIARLVDRFERDDVPYVLEGEAELEARREVERLRSFQRTLARGRAFKDAGTGLTATSITETLAAVGWDSSARALRAHQLGAVAHALAVLNAANFSVPGAGKTATTLAVLAMHLQAETVDVAVVVGPLASFAPWEYEAAASLPGVLRTRRIRGAGSAARRLLYQATEDRDLLLLTYPTVVADLRELLRLAERKRVLLIVDESHRIKRFKGGQWAPAMLDLAAACRVRIVLSGTPMPQSPLDLYTQLNVLWPKQELTGSRTAFKARADNDFLGLVESLQPIFTRTSKAALNIPPYEVIHRPCEMPPLQAELSELIENRFRRVLADAADWPAQLALLRKARPLRLLQVASNPDLLNQTDGFFQIPPVDDVGGTLMQRLAGYRQAELPAKYEEALRILADQVADSAKTVVWTSFVKNIDQFGDLLRRRLGVPVYTVDGRVPVEDDAAVTPDNPGEEVDVTREQRIQSFLNNPQPAVLVANPAACGESISLHRACTTAIYLDRTYDCARYLQSVDRIHRLGLPPEARVRVFVLQAVRDGQQGVDALVDNSLMAKQGRMQQLLEGGELLPAQIPQDGDADAAGGDAEDLAGLLHYLLGQ